MKNYRDSLIALGAILVLAVVTVLAAFQQAQQKEQLAALLSTSSQPNGGKVLRLWLDSIGYQTSTALPETFSIPENTDLILILEPTEAIDVAQQETINKWISTGGTLLLAGEGWITEDMASTYGYNYGYVFTDTSHISAASPAYSNPIQALPVELPVTRVLAFAQPVGDNSSSSTSTPSIPLPEKPKSLGLPILWTAQGLIAVSIQHDQGRIILLSVPGLLTNQGLKESGVPELVLNILSLAQNSKNKPGRVWIDEWHHGLRANYHEVIGPEAWLRETPAGQAILYSAAVVFLALILSGRSFGKPLPSSTTFQRRSPLEYITALANLSRRAGHRARVLLAEYQAIRRYYEHRYHISQDLSDQELVHTITQYSSGFDSASLLLLLQNLSQAALSTKTSEADMLRLINEAHQWLNKEGHPSNPVNQSGRT